MANKCFSCGESLHQDEQSILKRYKDISEKTGKQFYFYKIKGSKEIQITTSNDFQNFKKSNSKLFKAKKVEFANVLEFGNAADNNILEGNSGK